MKADDFRSLLLFLFVTSTCMACNKQSTRSNDEETFDVSSLAKSDVDTVLDIHVQQSRAYLQEIMFKLYKRNPRELKKSVNTAEENVRRLFDVEHNWSFVELEDTTGSDAIQLAFNPEYQGDRIFAFIAGLLSMIMSAYGDKKDFYMFDSVEPQKLYNAARNIEIAVWKLGHDRDEKGDLYIYSNSREGEITNLSYERLFGKLIALQDTMALIMEDQSKRLIKKVLQRMATAVFLPI